VIDAGTQPSLLEKLAPWISLFGTVASFLSLGITLAVYLSIKKLKEEFIRAVRIPELAGLLIGAEKNFEHILDAFDGSPPNKYLSGPLLSETLKLKEVCYSNLSSLIPKIEGHVKERALQLQDSLRSLGTISIIRRNLEDIVAQLSGVITAVRNDQKEKELVRRD
jgi:hypothetical protein